MLTEMFGNSKTHKIYDFLEKNNCFDFPVSEISRRTNISIPTVVEGLERLLSTKLIRETRKIGNSKYYTISDNKVTRHLRLAMIEHNKLINA